MSWGEVGSWVGGVVKDGMAGYFEVERAKATNPAASAAEQNAAFDSPELDENPTAQPNQGVADTANPGATVAGFSMDRQTMLIAGGLALAGVLIFMRR